jgi:gamma-glutamyl-gamma-aminobutyraldehyde dehydrogenase
LRFAALIEESAAELALLDTLCMGRPIGATYGSDIEEAAETLRFTAECMDKITGKITSSGSEVLHYVTHEPFGVVGAIVPWNYPLLLTIWKIAPALAAGNTVVLKPSELAPLSALRLGELFLSAGGPAGVLQVIPGRGEEAGRALALHQDVALLTFTGSTRVGGKLLTYAGESNLKPVHLECGGKSPHIFLRDLTDLDAAVAAAAHGIFDNAGQVCNAGSRLLVDRPILDSFVERFCAYAREHFLPGDPLDPETTLGPLASFSHREKVMSYLRTGIEEGARLMLGCGNTEPQETGAYVEPALFADVPAGSRLLTDEIFGPFAILQPIDGPDEAIAIANDTPYGLAAGLWTSSLDSAITLSRRIEAGVVWVNCYDEGDMTQPFGGWKLSGHGRDKCMESIVAYTHTRSTWIRLHSAAETSGEVDGSEAEADDEK